MNQERVEPETAAHAPVVSLRPAGPEDEEFLLAVYASTRADEMALVPWTDEQRRAFVQMQFAAQSREYQRHYPAAEHSVVMADGEPVGRIYVAREREAIKILDVTVLPAHRRCGFGTTLLRELCAEAKRTGLPLHIYVESFSPSLRLFARLGFEVVEESGLHRLLVWRPPAEG
jgi:GNAT superfamily N-acetyltransferase